MTSVKQSYNNEVKQENIKPGKYGKRKTRRAIVVSKSGNKSLVAKIERRFRHPIYGKVIKKHKKVYVHDEANSAQIGDVIEIRESRPMSSLKRWYLVKVLEHTNIEEKRKDEIKSEIEMVLTEKTE